jgi:hypothetical protein
MSIPVLERKCSLKEGTYDLKCKILEALSSRICVADMFCVLKSDHIGVYMRMQANFFNNILGTEGRKVPLNVLISCMITLVLIRIKYKVETYWALSV